MFEKIKGINFSSKTHCKGCGEKIAVGDERFLVVMPYQRRGVSFHCNCLNQFKTAYANGDTTSGISSENCANHNVTISRLDAVRFQYFLHYGFRRLGCGKVTADFINAESIGATIKTAFDAGADVTVNGKAVKSLEEYDVITKEICMR